jgi:hypothetical protein
MYSNVKFVRVLRTVPVVVAITTTLLYSKLAQIAENWFVEFVV